jgi:hypothetical protein
MGDGGHGEVTERLLAWSGGEAELQRVARLLRVWLLLAMKGEAANAG